MTKNIHIAHVEDLILDHGREGGLLSIEILDDLLANKCFITSKWDGNPAIVFGPNPENNRFFVGTKAVFNKTNPRICYTEQDIEQYYHQYPDLSSVLKLCLKYLPELKVPFVVQGEFMFSDDKVLMKEFDHRNYFTFQPNNICYAFPQSIFMTRTKIGVVVHTRYNGSTMSNLVAHFDVNLYDMAHTPNVWVWSAQMSAHVKPLYEPYYLQRARDELELITDDEFDRLFSKKTLIQLLKQYFNYLIKTNQNHYNSQLVSFVAHKKPKYAELATELLFAINKVVSFQSQIVTAKRLLIEQYEKNKSFLTFDEYMIPTPMEGYVATTKNRSSVKLVDRRVFSRMNFKRFTEGSPTT